MPTEPLAKSSGITLRAHRRHVHDEALRLLDGWKSEKAESFIEAKYRRLTGDELRRSTRQAAWWHDIGKNDEVGWQNACRLDYEAYRAWRKVNGLDPDEVCASDYACYQRICRRTGKNSGKNLLAFAKRTGFRHEFESVRTMRKPGISKREEFSLAEFVAVASHHGHLSKRSRDRERWQIECHGRFLDAWEFLNSESSLIMRNEQGQLRQDVDEVEFMLMERYRLAGPRALLRLADTRASRAEAGNDLAPIEPFSYTYPHKKPNRVQQLALNHADDWVTILRAPTGSGKTDAAFLWAERQVELGRADRLVFAMPTRFTSNALALSNAEALSQTGLYHSSAWYARYADLERGTLGYDMAKEEHKLARLLATPITVCTVDHLLISLTGSHEDHHATFFFLANSAVVFDEVDFYDPFVQANLVVLLRALGTLQVPVLLMSATVPESARTLYGVKAKIRQTEAHTSGHRALHPHDPVERPEDATDVLNRMLSEGTGIVYANTVERAYLMYEWLRDETNNPQGVPVYLYHSRFTEPDKKQVERTLLDALGKEAWKEQRAFGIAVLTQIGEMSINISAPLMLSDLCPWDRLAQRAGRLARFAEVIPEGELFVAEPQRKGTLYPAPYGSFDRGSGWTASDALVKTKQRLVTLLHENNQRLALTPKLLVDEVNELYPDAPELDVNAATNAALLEDLICRNWMIVQAAEASEDDGDITGGWRSRDIPLQKTVLVALPDDLQEHGPYHFENYEEAKGFLLDRTVECPHYLIKRGLKREVMCPFEYVVGFDDRDAETIWYCNEYDRPVGGQGGGLGALAVRDREDSFSRVAP